VVTFAAGEDRHVAESSFVAIHAALGREVAEIVGDRPLQFAGVRTLNEPDLRRDGELADEGIA
jgi:hypothetical protein